MCVLLFQDISELRALIEELKEVQNTNKRRRKNLGIKYLTKQ